MINPDKEQIKSFLESWPHTKWATLTAIPVDGGKTQTTTFSLDDINGTVEWAERLNADHNIYFAVNPLKQPMTKKATRDDVESLQWIHIDIDRPGEDELHKLRAFDPAPTAIVFSGGGYHAYWRLSEPQPTGGAEAYNVAMQQKFDADSCQNIDRILRIPGTVNWPNEKKRKAGRNPAMASMVEHHPDHVYDISLFDKAEPELTVAEAEIDVDPKKARRLAELPTSIKGDARIVVTQGSDPENPDRFAKEDGSVDRSKALYYCVCQMIRDGVEEQTIFNIVTDPGWAISESVLDKGRSADSYAMRQIAKAKAECEAQVEDSTIIMREGQLNRIVERAEQVLIVNDLDVFQRGSEVVRVATVGKSAESHPVQREEGTQLILPVQEHYLVQLWDDNSKWARINTKGELCARDPELKYAKHYLARVGDWKLRHLAGVINTPTLRRDGSLLDAPGYDEATGLLYDPRDVQFPPIVKDADHSTAQAAMLELYKPFSKFPCVSDAGKSVLLSAVLTALVRNMFDASPMHVLDAPAAGTGKSLAADAVGIIALGHNPAATAQGKTEEEDEKRLATILREGDAVIMIDNITQPLDGQFLCSAITQATVQARILGKSERVILPTRALFLANGNNVAIHADMTRRVLMCRMDAGVERPERRQFDFCPREYCREHRTKLVAAGLTAVRAYLNAGRPMEQQVPKLGSFEQWNLIREVLVWLNYADPAQTQDAVMENDDKRDEIAEFLAMWQEHWAGQELTAGQIMSLAEVSSDVLIRECVLDKCGGREWNHRKLGRWLGGHRDSVVGGLVLRKKGRNGGWYVKETS